MALRSPISRLFTARSVRERKPRRPLAVELLEDRVTPSIVTVPPPTTAVGYAPTVFTDGVSLSGVHTLRDAVIAANANPTTGLATINLNSGTYTLSLKNTSYQENAARTGDLDITSKAHKLLIQGKGTVGATATIIDASALLDRVFQIVNAGTSVEVDNLVLKGGQARDNGWILSSAALGGGVLNNGGNLTLNNVIFQSNSAVANYQNVTFTTTGPTLDGQLAEGGGLYSSGGNLVITNSTFTNNKALGGSGLDGAGSMDFVTYRAGGSGGAAMGGALYVGAGSLTASNVHIDANSALGGNGGNGSLSNATNSGAPGLAGAGQGGGIFVNAGTVSFDGPSTLTNNRAQGGMGGSGGTCMIAVGSIVPRCSDGAVGQGGALYAAGGTVTLNGAITGNVAQGGQGGVEIIADAAGNYVTSGPGGNGGAGQGGGLSSAGTSAVILTSTASVASNKALGGDGNWSNSTYDSHPAGSGGAGQGGGAYAGGASLTTSASFTSNAALGGKGSFDYVDDSPYPDGVGGSGGAGQGGGVFVASGTNSFNSATIASNSATGGIGDIGGHSGGSGGAGQGGGLFTAVTVTLNKVTLASNTALGADGPNYAAQGGRPGVTWDGYGGAG